MILPHDCDPGPEPHAIRADLIRRLMAGLRARDAEVVARRFGLGCPAETLREIGADLGVTAERVRAIEGRGLRHMRRRARRMGVCHG